MLCCCLFTFVFKIANKTLLSSPLARCATKSKHAFVTWINSAQKITQYEKRIKIIPETHLVWQGVLKNVVPGTKNIKIGHCGLIWLLEGQNGLTPLKS